MTTIIQETEKSHKIQQYLYMGQWAISISSDCELITSGLGSCIALCLYDSILKVGGMAHIVLPSRNIKNNEDGQNSTKVDVSLLNARYADEAIHILVNRMKEQYNTANLCAKLAGGSQMFQGLDKKDINGAGFLPIGLNNAESVKKELHQLKIPIYGADLGGYNGRTVSFNIGTGKVYIKKIGLSELLII